MNVRSLRALGLVCGAALSLSLLSSTTGCTQSTASHAVSPAATPSAVTVDFYAGGKVSAACAGTLLSASVVLTAAHCADNSTAARVRAPDMGGQSADAAEVIRYDWAQAVNHAEEHDLALVVLASPITGGAFAAVNGGSCLGCDTVVLGRSRAQTTKSGPLTIGTRSPLGRPFATELAGVPEAAVGGGGVRASDGTLIGVYMGAGGTTRDGYVARIDMPEVVIWMTAVVRENGGVLSTTLPATPVGTIKAQSVNVLNTGGGGGGGGGGSGGGGGGGDDGAGTGPDSASDGSGTPGDAQEDVGDDASSADGDNASSSGSDNGSSDAPGAYSTKAHHPDAEPPDGLSRTKGDNYWFSAEKGDPAFKNDVSYAGAHSDVALAGAHGWPGDMEDVPDDATLHALTHGVDANGNPVTKPLIVDSCYAGAKNTVDPSNPDGSRSNAASLGKRAGIPLGQSYGCTGEENTPNSSTLRCDGSWVDGNGHPVSASDMSKYGMQNCKVRQRDSDGAWVKVDC